MTNDEPPTEVLSVYVGWMPRYSASWRVGDQPAEPAVKMPSTSVSVDAGVVEGVAGGLGVELERRLVGDDADLVGLVGADDGDPP